jgi:cytochrome c nitrite reductase small subunit
MTLAFPAFLADTWLDKGIRPLWPGFRPLREPAAESHPQDMVDRLEKLLWAWAPSFRVLLVAALIGGAVFGLGAFTFVYAQGYSYLLDDPTACANCHIKRDYFDGWNRSPHHAVATCNDCHTPHDSILSKYAIKALNGFNHSRAFTFGGFPEPIQITSLNLQVTQASCVACHGGFVSEIAHAESVDPTACWTCHAGVGHGK